ncbi:MAG: GldG family protein [Gammaproteobacteria bacterium]|nr:GldG family protein [Gammaproteobacteria bacterium]
MKATPKTHLQYRIQHLIFIVLLLACIGFAGWMSNEYNQRSDWTAGKRHSLSNDTLLLLKELPFPVNLRSYQADDPALNKAITEILNRYQQNKSDFTFKLINPDIFIEQAKADNINRYGQTVIEYNGQIERVDTLSEESISNALIRLHRNHKPELLFVSQHGERSPHDTSAIGYSELASKLTGKGFKISEINLLQQVLPVENSVLILGSINKPLLANEKNKILQYIKDGGQLLWLQDPGIDDSQLSLAAELNINFIDGVVVDNNKEVNRMLQLSHPAIIPILEYKRHPITEKMKYFTLFTTATAISSNQKSNDAKNSWITSDLLISSENSWSETDNFILGVEFNKEKDLQGPLSIGIALHRQIKPDSKSNTQRAVIIGDTDFIANNKLGNGANLEFVINTLNWLTRNDNLISINPKNAPDLKLNLTAPVAALLGLLFLITLPILFFIIGAVIWVKRKKN